MGSNGLTTTLYYLLVFLTGLLIGGVYNNVSGAIVIELSNMKELKGNLYQFSRQP